MTDTNSNYIVLARKYRPQDLTELVGQEALVKILNNSIRENKVAHSFLLTGIRGIGKTTTARIIAKTLNCTDLQQSEGIFIPCKKCKNCLSCSEQNHPDIIELDAASKTGVGDIREVIENSSYSPILGKYKIYIIDEVHMLSNNAFNALLKTLEEPPAHLKFIFATTEYRKIPLTIVSRCQKHELRSFTVDSLMGLIKKVCKKESIAFEEDAIKVLATHARGSARDALSLLDMVVLNSDNKLITTTFIEKALGVSDKETLYKLLENLIKGNAKNCLDIAQNLFLQGVESSYLLEDLLEICTESSKVLAVENYINSSLLSDFDRIQLKNLTSFTDIPRLSRVWQMLFKGISELKYSDLPIATIEMLFIRICYLSSEPTPIELLSEIKKKINQHTLTDNKTLSDNSLIQESSNQTLSTLTFEDIVALFKEKKEMFLYHHLKSDVAPVLISGNNLKIKLINHLDSNILNQLKNKLRDFTSQNWVIEVERDNRNSIDLQTLEEKELEDIKNNEIISSVLGKFSGSKIESIKTKNN